MSSYARAVRTFADRYGVTPRHRSLLLAHWPLVKLFWLSEFGRGRARGLAARLYPAFARHGIVIEVDGGNGRRMAIPVSFDRYELQTFREIFLGEEYAAPFDIARAHTIVDLGANTGLAALWFFARCDVERLIAVEANPALIDRMERTLRGPLAEGRAVIANRAVVPSETGEPVRFHVSDNPRHGSTAVIDSQTREVSVPGVTLRALLDDHALERADILKMDIEGAEHDLLAADPDVFTRFGSVFAEVHGDPERRDGFARGLEALGFEIARRTAEPDAGCETVVARRRA